ncbi:MAG: sigma-70 family RNA polymerase sigma factor [Firmicutes bacterium]|nr:sigma-70 family RNA polymerase sigma factor [Bacillota bacterium]
MANIENGQSYRGWSFSLDVPENFEIFRQILRQGGERRGSQLRIISHFSVEHTREESIAFLQHEFREGYRGYVFPEGQIAVGYVPDGFLVGWGDSVLSNNADNVTNATLYPWDFVAITLSNMLHRGEFLPQNILDQAFDHEALAAAEYLWNLHQALIESRTLLMDDEVFKGGFPDSTARLAGMLKNPAAHAEIAASLELFAAAYAQDRGVLRHQHYKPEDVLRKIEDVQAPHTRFETAPDFTYHPPRMFISQDEVDVTLRHGGVSGGKFTIYEYFSQPHTPQEQAAFLKHHYGFLGSYSDEKNESFNEKGVHVSHGSIMEPDVAVTLSWPMVAKRVAQLIAADRYLTLAEKEQLPAYLAQLAERRQSASAPEPEPAEEETPMEFRYAVGDQVYLGAQGYEVAAVGETTVSLYNPRFPLLNDELSRDEFERRLWQDARNDHLKVPVEEEPERALAPETPRELYQQYLPLLLDDLRASDIYPYLRDNDSYAEVAHELVHDWVFTASLDAETYPGLDDALRLPEFHNWLAEDLFQNTFQDVVVDSRNQLEQHEFDRDAPEWAKRPLPEQNPETDTSERTVDDAFNEYSILFIQRVLRDEPYLNAYTNADAENARIECDAAVDRAALHLGTEDMELYKLFHDTPGFRERMCDYVFDRTYTQTKREIQRVLKPPTKRATTEQRNFRFLNELAPEILSGEATYLRFQSGAGMMPLSIDLLDDNRLSFAHNYEQNGDLMADPDMTFVFDREAATLSARTYQQDGLNMYQRVERFDGIYNHALEHQLNAFTAQWFRNIRSQGYRRDVMHVRYADDELELVYAEDDSVRLINGEVTLAERYAREHGIVLPAKPQTTETVPDPSITADERDKYGYTEDDMYPLSAQRAVEMYDTGHPIYLLFPDNTEALAEDRDEIITFSDDGLCGITHTDWVMSPVYIQQQDTVQEQDTTVVPAPALPKLGDRYEIDGRRFEVDTVEGNSVSLRDVTFENGTGFPIFRRESLDFLRMYDPVADAKETPTHESNAHDWYRVGDDVYIDGTPLQIASISTHDDIHGIVMLRGADGTSRREGFQRFDALLMGDDRNRQLRSVRLQQDNPDAVRRNFRITDGALGHGGAKAKYEANIKAILYLKSLDEEGKLATPAEQEILSRYVGWGGLPQAFDPDNAQWAGEYQELQALLAPEEYTTARASTLNAHYTSPTVIKAIYKAIENMGFTQGNVLEPSCGIGNFFGLVPEIMAVSKLYGIELDPITGRIARQLYQNVNIAIEGFESTELPDSFFDLAVGNVPFGEYSVADRRYDKYKFSIHDYFFAKTLDKVRPGGVVAFITSKYTLDKKDPAIRKYIAQRAELLGAIRLPNTAFKANAGTEVTTDIIFLQKRDRAIEIEPDWVHLGQTENGITVNSYFAENPDMILGTMTTESTQYGHDTTCTPLPERDLADLLDEAIQNIHGEIADYERDDQQEQEGAIPADPSVRNFSYTIYKGSVYFRENSIMLPQELSATARSRVKGMIDIRDCTRRLIEWQTENAPDEIIQREQARLNQLYDAYTAKYGLLNDRANAAVFRDDGSYPLLCSLEHLDEDRNLKAKADMFSKRTIRPYAPITHVDTAAEALTVSMAEKARVDLGFMEQLSGLSRERLIADLEGVIFLNIGSAESQDKAYVTADEYLSGNVRKKLDEARAAAAVLPELEVNVRALEAAQPKDLTAAEISVRLGATWVPTDVVQDFIFELLEPGYWAKREVQVHYSQYTAEWNITGKSVEKNSIAARLTYGTDRISAYHIIEQTLNLRTVKVFDTVYDGEKEKRVLNPQETAIAQGKQEIIKAKFLDWVWDDPDRRERLCRIYNSRYNSTRPREYDGSHIQFVGMNPEIAMETHQRNGVARHLYGGNTLLGHVVGAGKTYTMIAAAMESKRLGLSHKALFVVPNNIVGQFSSEFLQLYPSANVLMVTAHDFEKQNRRKFCARIATGDYDGIVMAHSQFEKLAMSVEWQKDFLQQQVEDLADGIADMKWQDGERVTVKQMERIRKSLQTKIQKLNDQERKDDMLTFEELGVDLLFIDEADLFKNLMIVTKMRNVAGIGQSDAQKASDLFMKTRYLDQLTGRRGVVFATGTPISNTMAEMYTMQRYLQYDALVERGLEHFDCWASTFGETVTAMELAPEGTGFRMKTRFAKFYNLPELMAMFREVADIQTADMLNLPTPKVNYHVVAAKPSEHQQAMVQGLAARADRIRKREVAPTEDNMLLVTNDGRKLALDQRLVNPLLPDVPGSKVNLCVENMFRIWQDTAAKRLTQLGFIDLSTPKDGIEFDVYHDVKEKLLLRGVPSDEIAFIHEAKNEAQKQALFGRVRTGAVRVLLGSTAKMGAGTNVQDLIKAMHDLDCPWRPREVGQAKRTVYSLALDSKPLNRYTIDMTMKGGARLLLFFLSMLESHEEKLKFAELYEANRDRMARLAWGILRDNYLAEDAVNEAFLKMIHKIKKFHDFTCDQMRDYLVIIVKHTAIDMYNERKKNAEVSFDERFTMGGVVEAEPISMMLEHDEVQEAIDQLDEIYRDVLYLSYRVGLSINEIAKSLDLSPSAVKMRLVRARVKLRALLEGDDVK